MKHLLSENAPISTKKKEYTYKEATQEEMLLLKKKVARDKRRSIGLRALTFVILVLLGAYALQLIFT